MRFEDLMQIGIIFVVISVTLAVGVKINTDIGSGLTGDAAAVTANGTAGMLEIASWLPLIGLVIAATVIISLIVTQFGKAA